MHCLGEFFDGGIRSHTSIVEFFFPDRTHSESLVVMSRIDTSCVRECVEFCDALMEFCRRSLLKICPTGLANEECISGEDHIFDEIARTSISMSWSSK